LDTSLIPIKKNNCRLILEPIDGKPAEGKVRKTSSFAKVDVFQPPEGVNPSQSYWGSLHWLHTSSLPLEVASPSLT
jgi:hypothetical protein